MCNLLKYPSTKPDQTQSGCTPLGFSKKWWVCLYALELHGYEGKTKPRSQTEDKEKVALVHPNFCFVFHLLE